jgi:hypothetical protein
MTMMERRIIEVAMYGLIILALALMSCSSGGGGGSDTVPLTITSSNPANGATKVSILSSIQVTVSESLDTTTVTLSSISLRTDYAHGNNSAVKGVVSYDDATKTIIFTPSRKLFNDSKYALTLSGVKDLFGNIMPDSKISFTTYMNLILRDTNYTAGSVSSYGTYTYDANGNQTKYVYYNGAGADATWFTADDVVQYEYEFETSF